MPLTVPDLLVYVRSPTENDPDRLELATQLVDLANGLVEEVTGVLAVEPARVQAIRLEVAARAWHNPEGYTSGSIDDYSWSRAGSRTGVYLTAEERDDLMSLAAGDSTPGPWAGSVPYGRSW